MEQFSTQKHYKYAKIFVIITSIAITGLLFWNISLFLDRLKKVERDKMKIWAQSQKSFISNNENDYLELNLLISTSNTSIPIINLDENGNLNLHTNVSKDILNNKQKLRIYIDQLKSENVPITLQLPNGSKQYLYYGNSPILTKLKYYPIAIIIVILLLAAIVYFLLMNTKINEQNNLWVGMAKETAHQIGTPLSALSGWVEILKSENVNESYIVEIEKDLYRLEQITDRFSKIGSKPELIKLNIASQTLETFHYLEKRSSKFVKFSSHIPKEASSIVIPINQVLFGWTIENIVKNGIDAMKGKGNIHLEIKTEKNLVHILISDTGKGMTKRQFQKIFDLGYTSKKRGWGLGLSLAKRIIVDYHGGRIRVKHSQVNKGTTFQITLKK